MRKMWVNNIGYVHSERREVVRAEVRIKRGFLRGYSRFCKSSRRFCSIRFNDQDLSRHDRWKYEYCSKPRVGGLLRARQHHALARGTYSRPQSCFQNQACSFLRLARLSSHQAHWKSLSTAADSLLIHRNPGKVQVSRNHQADNDRLYLLYLPDQLTHYSAMSEM